MANQKLEFTSRLLEESNFANPDQMTGVAALAVTLGAIKVQEIHGASREVLKVEYKAADGDTPKTVADMESGKIIKGLIGEKFPTHGINEEETGVTEGTVFKWHVDPLDGTSSFAREQRYSTTGIAVYENGRPQIAAICHPFERELLIAEAGHGARMYKLNNRLELTEESKPIKVSDNKNLKGGVVYMDALFNGQTTGRKLELTRQLVVLAMNNLGIRATGSNIDQQRQVATGRAEATFTDAVGGFFDLAPGSLLIKEAGGEFTDMYGNKVDETTQVALGTNGFLHQAMLRVVEDCYQGYTGFRN